MAWQEHKLNIKYWRRHNCDFENKINGMYFIEKRGSINVIYSLLFSTTS